MRPSLFGHPPDSASCIQGGSLLACGVFSVWGAWKLAELRSRFCFLFNLSVCLLLPVEAPSTFAKVAENTGTGGIAGLGRRLDKHCGRALCRYHYHTRACARAIPNLELAPVGEGGG